MANLRVEAAAVAVSTTPAGTSPTLAEVSSLLAVLLLSIELLLLPSHAA